MLIGYARVSTDLQTTEGQINSLKTAGCKRVLTEAMSGAVRIAPSLRLPWNSCATGTCWWWCGSTGGRGRCANC
jgi:resolvase-like protein